MPDPDEDIPGQNTRVYLLDVWIPPDADPGRFRLEAQLKVGYWIGPYRSPSLSLSYVQKAAKEGGDPISSNVQPLLADSTVNGFHIFKSKIFD